MLLEVQINLKAADHTIKTSAYQVYAQMPIKHIQVFEGYVCIFSLKFKMRAVQTTISQRIIKRVDERYFQSKTTLKINKFQQRTIACTPSPKSS